MKAMNMIIGGNMKDLKLLVNYYGDMTVKEILEHMAETNFSIFEAQNPNWDYDLF